MTQQEDDDEDSDMPDETEPTPSFYEKSVKAEVEIIDGYRIAAQQMSRDAASPPRTSRMEVASDTGAASAAVRSGASSSSSAWGDYRPGQVENHRGRDHVWQDWDWRGSRLEPRSYANALNLDPGQRGKGSKGSSRGSGKPWRGSSRGSRDSWQDSSWNSRR